jgi:hypothetical protein
MIDGALGDSVGFHMIGRRGFLRSFAASGVLSAAARGKAPYRVLYNNDTTNVTTVRSPFHEKGGPFTAGKLEASVDEAARVDVHLLQPGYCWIPWWKSKVYPVEEHWQWVQERGIRPDPWGASFFDYLLRGGDILEVFTRRCRRNGVAPFVSFRLNDGHMQEYAGTRNPRSIFVSRFYEEHPEFRLGPRPDNWDERVHNWMIREVRDYKYEFVEEICENYDIDGLELDFLRHFSYFRQAETTSAQREQVMTGFVRRVRRLLDRTSPRGRRRRLCARVPCYLELHDALGIDLVKLVDAGLDMVNLSANYYTVDSTDLPRVRKLVPDAAVYLEMTHTTAVGPRIGRGYDDSLFLRTTDAQFYTAAHAAYENGADGVSLFNFAYYREYGRAERGPWNEPPFQVLPRLGDGAWLARQQQWYVYTKNWGSTPKNFRVVPKRLANGSPCSFAMDLASAPGRAKCLVRVRTEQDCSSSEWTLKLNGAEFSRAAYQEKPIAHPYAGPFGRPEQYACFEGPAATLRKGMNTMVLTPSASASATVDYVDLLVL